MRTLAALGASATLLGSSCFLSGCLLHFGPTHSEQVIARDSTSSAPPTSSTTTTTTTTTLHPHCGNYDLFLEDVRPQAGPLLEQKGTFRDETDCCSACHASDDCMAFVFFYPTLTCQFLPNKAVWSAWSPDELFLGAEGGYLTGMKAVVTCDGCNDCGRNWDEQSWWKDCTKCSNPDNWNQYPCFLPEGCKCGGDMSPWYPPDPCASYWGDWSKGEPCTDGNWNPECCHGDAWNSLTV